MKKISGVVIAFNEEEKIERALSSLSKVCDEIVVVDSGSEDATREICLRYTPRVLEEPWRGYREQKQFATEQAQHEWVLSLDADEELDDELKGEILHWKESAGRDSCFGFHISRKARFMGRWIKHTTWYPDRQLRLFLHARGKWSGARLHESFQVNGPVGRMKGHILHYSYSSVSEYLSQLQRFSEPAALDAYDRGRRARLVHLLIVPPLVFLKNFVLHRGFLDGVPGLAVSWMAAVSSLFKYLHLWELQHHLKEGKSKDALR